MKNQVDGTCVTSRRLTVDPLAKFQKPFRVS